MDITLDLSDVSRTAILTLVYRVIETEKKKSFYNDPMAVHYFNKLMSYVPEEEKAVILKLKKTYSSMPRYGDVIPGIQRVVIIDKVVDDYITNNQNCTVINLACGFDTRYWRINHNSCKYIELDLPEVIALKRFLFQGEAEYELIGCSIFDSAWIDKVTANGNSKFILIAEGLLCYLEENEVRAILEEISKRFQDSQFIFDNVNELYTKGLFNKLLTWSFKHYLGINTEWKFGFKKPKDIETYNAGFKLIDTKKTQKVSTIITTSINSKQ